jgi:glycerate 2-kinase
LTAAFRVGERGFPVLKKRQPEMSQIPHIFQAALAAVDPFLLVTKHLRLQGNRLSAGPHHFDLDKTGDIVVVGAGKAAAGMGLAVEAALGDRISRGLLVLPKGSRAPFKVLGQAHAAHPVPDEEGARATNEILAMLEKVGKKTLVLCVISGGASALLAAPAPGVTLADKQAVTRLLLQAGAAIGELNAVRKHLSSVKGGRLAAAAFPAAVLTLVISDVVGDPLDVIGSGPTVHDASTYADAWTVVEKYRLQKKIPARARGFLERGMAGLEAETLKENDPRLACSQHLVIGNNAMALEGARKKAEAIGWPAEVAAAPLRGDARDAARSLATAALRAQAKLKPGERRCLLSGGETTVRVRGQGRGGRNQELALAFALEIAGTTGIEMLSAGSDGVDGPTDAAGAIVDGQTVERAARLGLDAAAFLDDNDSYFFFCKLDRLSGERLHIKTGPTGTNVMDLQVILIAGQG